MKHHYQGDPVVSASTARECMEAFRNGFPPGTYKRWEISGAARRGVDRCPNVVHLVIPATGMKKVGGTLFSVEEEVNLVMDTLDGLLAAGDVRQAAANADLTGTRWGDKQRSVAPRRSVGGGVPHEIVMATRENWGWRQVWHTGPAEFTRAILRRLGQMRVVAEGGQLRKIGGDRLVTPEELDVFRLAGIAAVEPRNRAAAAKMMAREDSAALGGR